jgi:predicted kinase
VTVRSTGLPSLVVVTGPPAGGKTTLARAIAETLGWPLLAKDEIKETLFDTLGIGDREWSHRLGAASMELLTRLVRGQLEAGRSIVAEANFRWPGELPECVVVQVFCDAPADVLLERILERTRHPGHLERDPEHLADVEDSLRADYAPLPLDGALLARVWPAVLLPVAYAAIRGVFCAPRRRVDVGSRTTSALRVLLLLDAAALGGWLGIALAGAVLIDNAALLALR